MSGILHYLVPLPVVLPLLSAGVQFAFRGRVALVQRSISIATLSAVLLTGLVLMVGTDTYGPQAVHVGGWAAPIGIALVADRLSALMVTVSSAITLAVMVYSIGQGMDRAAHRDAKR